MHLEHLTAALIHLSLAFDPKETPQGASFWLDVRRRLNDYRNVAMTPGLLPGDHAPPTALPAMGKFPAFPSLNWNYARVAGENIDLAFTWDNTKEGQSYWSLVSKLLRQYAPHIDCASLDHREGPYVDCLSEAGQLKRLGFEPPGFAGELWYRPGMWPHHDPENRGLVRYVPQGKPALSKNFVSAKPGKFLAAHYSEHLTEPLIADFAAKFRTAAEPPALLLARTADEIAHVYANGPFSCMSSGKKCDGIEPVRAYASPDLAIAYLMRGTAITARALVCPERKIHSRIYGDEIVFSAALSKNGYKNIYKGTIQNHHAFDGLRLAPLAVKDWRPAKKIHEDAGEPILIAPFFDLSCGGAWWDGEWLRIGPIPPGEPRRANHAMAGGYTLAAIPHDKIPIHPTSRLHIEVRVGSQGGNTNTHMTLTEVGREPQRTTADASREALAAKQAREAAINAQAANQLGQGNLGRILRRELEAVRQQEIYRQAAADANRINVRGPGFGGF